MEIFWTLTVIMKIIIQKPCLGRVIRILHECEVLIEKSVPKVTVWHHSAEPRDAKL